MANYGLQIISRTTMIKSELTVHLRAASAIVPGQGIKSICKKSFGHAPHVSSVSASFKTVLDDNQFFRTLRDPVKIEKVIVGRSNSFSYNTLK
jgi:hypothetical protein